MEAFYVPVKKSGVRMNISKTKTDAITGKRALIPILSQGTFSSLMNTLASADLVQEVPGPPETGRKSITGSQHQAPWYCSSREKIPENGSELYIRLSDVHLIIKCTSDKNFSFHAVWPGRWEGGGPQF